MKGDIDQVAISELDVRRTSPLLLLLGLLQRRDQRILFFLIVVDFVVLAVVLGLAIFLLFIAGTTKGKEPFIISSTRTPCYEIFRHFKGA
jgi:hypothetical protein